MKIVQFGIHESQDYRKKGYTLRMELDVSTAQEANELLAKMLELAETPEDTTAPQEVPGEKEPVDVLNLLEVSRRPPSGLPPDVESPLPPSVYAKPWRKTTMRSSSAGGGGGFSMADALVEASSGDHMNEPTDDEERDW